MNRQNQQKNLKFNVPSKETSRRLFAAVDAFAALAPWGWMGDAQVVAVRDPQSDRIAYCVVMGSGDMCCGLDAMLGDNGLRAYREAMLEDDQEPDMDFLQHKDSLAVFLENKNMLVPEDLAFCKAAGASYSASQFWPQFRRFEPGFFPWVLDESDVAFMSVCLEQVVDVARRAKDAPDILGPQDQQTFLARTPVQTDQGIIWQEEFISPQPLERVIQITPKVDNVLLEKVFGAAKKTSMVWEADCFIGQMPIGQPGERPRFPFCYMMADHHSGLILDMNLVDNNDYGAAFLDQICAAVKKNGTYPQMIYIRHPYLTAVFVPLKIFGIATQVVKELPMISFARKQMGKALKAKARSSKSPRQAKVKKILGWGKNKVFQFKVTLNNIRPAIWRRFQVRSNITLKRLAATIIIVMDWDNCHLHQFEIGKKKYTIPHEDFDGVEDFEDEGDFRLCDFSPDEIKRFVFEYDFGDGWEHAVLLEKVLEPQKGVKYPLCLAGERNCPPEDCGGPWGYKNFLEVIRDTKHPEHVEMLEWAGDDFDSEEFDVNITNLSLRHVAWEEKFFEDG